MSQSKPVLRIKLCPNTRASVIYDSIQYSRVQGSDHWEVTITVTTSEGHVTMQKFSDSEKGKALGKAYKWVEKETMEIWFKPWAAEQHKEFDKTIHAQNPSLRSRFFGLLMRVNEGKLDKERFQDAWQMRLDGLNLRGDLVDEPESKPLKDDHVTVKWSFWNWFK